MNAPALRLSAHWAPGLDTLARRVARAVDRPILALRLEAALRVHGAPIAYEIFDHRFRLCAPDLPGVAGDPDIALVLGDAEHDLFYVAVRERGALGALSVHEGVLDAVADLLGRAAAGLASPRRLAAELAPFDFG